MRFIRDIISDRSEGKAPEAEEEKQVSDSTPRPPVRDRTMTRLSDGLAMDMSEDEVFKRLMRAEFVNLPEGDEVEDTADEQDPAVEASLLEEEPDGDDMPDNDFRVARGDLSERDTPSSEEPSEEQEMPTLSADFASKRRLNDAETEAPTLRTFSDAQDDEPQSNDFETSSVREFPKSPAPMGSKSADNLSGRMRRGAPPAPSMDAGMPKRDDAIVSVPGPASGRSGRGAGRVKTRLLGFGTDEAPMRDPFQNAAPAAPASEASFPVGWLVVIDGPGKGASFALQSGVSQIGRGDDQAIRLDFGDTSISRSNHAAIAYDTEQGGFFLGYGGKANMVRLNDRPVLSTEELTSGAIIRIGETVMRFVAFCDKDFNWAQGGAGSHDRRA